MDAVVKLQRRYASSLIAKASIRCQHTQAGRFYCNYLHNSYVQSHRSRELFLPTTACSISNNILTAQLRLRSTRKRNPKFTVWGAGYKALFEYINEHGNAIVPYNYKSKNGVWLGHWVHRQRLEHEDNNISSERVCRLNELGFCWEKSNEWLGRYKELLEYKDKHGDTLVPQRYEENLSLGNWVDNQRTEYKSGNLSPERIKKLEEIEFVWDPNNDQWIKRYEELLQYEEKQGDAMVPARYEENPSLGKWVSKQRHAYKSGNLSSERIQKLEEIGFVWDPFNDQWSELYEELLEYKEKRGDTLVPYVYEDNLSLGLWVGTQRKEYKAEKLLPERIQKLEGIGFVWDPFNDQWSERYEDLLQYREKHGDTLVPYVYEENLSLGVWVGTQRQEYKSGNLSHERTQKLNEAGFVWDPMKDQWPSHYNKLLHYIKKYGNALVPQRFQENPVLGKWVSTQRTNYKSGKLSSERIKMLNEAGFVWDARGRQRR